MQNSIYNIALYFILAQIISFIWYYISLTKITTDSKTTNITIKSSLTKFLIFMLPYYIFVSWFIYIYKSSSIKVCDQLPSMIDTLKQLCAK